MTGVMPTRHPFLTGHDGMKGMDMALVEEQAEWTDGDGTAHTLTLEARGGSYVVRHLLSLRGGSAASWEQIYDHVDEARDAFTSVDKA